MDGGGHDGGITSPTPENSLNIKAKLHVGLFCGSGQNQDFVQDEEWHVKTSTNIKLDAVIDN